MRKNLLVRVSAAVTVALLVATAALSASAIVAAPGNDTYQRATRLSINGGTRTGDTTNATAQNNRETDSPLEWIGGGDTHTVWFQLGGRAGLLTIDTCTSPGFDTMIEVFERGATDGVRYGESDRVYSSDSGCASANGALVQFTTHAQTRYYVRVRGASVNKFGTFTLKWSFSRGSGRR